MVFPHSVENWMDLTVRQGPMSESPLGPLIRHTLRRPMHADLSFQRSLNLFY